MNKNLVICPLTDDYQDVKDKFTRNFVKQNNHEFREASAVFKYGGRYCMISSGCTGWDYNEAEYAGSDTMMGTWKVKGNPCIGKDAERTYFVQSTFVLPVYGKENAFILMLDR